MSRLIPLTQGQCAIVDDDDFAWLSQWKWHAQKNGRGGFYAKRRGENRQVISMHREIIQTPKGLVTDHVDGNGLNNQRSNLRLATQLQNMMNRRGKRGGTSRFKGVWVDPSPRNLKAWRAAIRVDGKLCYLGRFTTEEEAGAAYAHAAAEHFGHFANTTSGEIL
ncbi:MAG TPA: HNH endonuclease [Brevundimonas sp.]|jgi:hypothetical protein|uniref:HNH endonuclease n=1 Tax=Brevundimonas sp. TaxID=1871086 RepID=UPI002E14C08C|nr:HNH endonuclease [Brevundimonas sp.]